MKTAQKYIRLMPAGYGHYEVTIDMYNKSITFVINDMQAIDDYRDEDDIRRHNRGYKKLLWWARKSYDLSKSI